MDIWMHGWMDGRMHMGIMNEQMGGEGGWDNGLTELDRE